MALMALFTMNLWAQQTQGAGKPRFDPQEFQQRMEEALTRQAGLTADEAKAYADLPNREQLMGQIAGLISGFARGIAVGINEIPAGLARTINAVSGQQNAA